MTLKSMPLGRYLDQTFGYCMTMTKCIVKVQKKKINLKMTE